jgi:hypothetical protein
MHGARNYAHVCRDSGAGVPHGGPGIADCGCGRVGDHGAVGQRSHAGIDADLAAPHSGGAGSNGSPGDR